VAVQRNAHFIILQLQTAVELVTAASQRVGFFNPVARGEEESLRLDSERVDFWVSQGAQLSERVAKLVKDSKAA
jgi:ribosomal protein S16